MTLLDDLTAAHPVVGPLMANVLACLCEKAAQVPNPPAHCCFRVGTDVIHDAGVSVDQCCEGVAYVLLGDWYPSAVSFPEEDIVRQANSNCVPPTWGITFNLGIIRCIDVGGIDPMECDSWNSAAVQNLWDARALARTACCIRDYVNHDNPQLLGMSVVIGRQSQSNPLGGCIERSLAMTIQVPNCECG